MNMYDQTAQSRLKEKLDYEFWLLDFLYKTQETFEGGSNISTITLTNRQPRAHVAITLTEVIGSGTAMKVMDAMMPLTFTASYKILDMLFEWILEENKRAGNVQKIPWRFKEKIEIISSDRLIYPPLLQSEPYIGDYLFALYLNLLKFRNEIVHKNNFSVLNDKLRVETIENSHLYSIELDRGELGALVRTVVAAVNLLTGVLSFGEQEDCLLKYHLDRIKKLHRLAEFGQEKPILVNGILKVPEEKGAFPVDVKFVREQISRKHPNVDVLFNLKVIGLVNDKPSVCWFFPVGSVPKVDVSELRPDDYKEYLIPLEED
ncbi:MAG: hypothetical protein WBC40_04310 [Halobacteriota archaeon]